jgi:hypothetical protein
MGKRMSVVLSLDMVADALRLQELLAALHPAGRELQLAQTFHLVGRQRKKRIQLPG